MNGAVGEPSISLLIGERFRAPESSKSKGSQMFFFSAKMLGNYFSFLGSFSRNYYIRYVAKVLVAYGFFLFLLFF